MEKMKQELPLWRCHASRSASLDLLRIRALQAVVAIPGSHRVPGKVTHHGIPWRVLVQRGLAVLAMTSDPTAMVMGLNQPG